MLTPEQVEDYLHKLSSGREKGPSHDVQMTEIGIAQAFQLTRIAVALEKIAKEGIYNYPSGTEEEESEGG